MSSRATEISRALIVGYGSIGRRHFRIIREALPLCDIRILRSRGITGKEERENFLRSFDEVEQFLPEIAIIASPAPFHLDASKKLIEMGTHLLIEKPISSDTAGVEDLIQMAEKMSCVVRVGYNLRFMRSLQKFRQVINDRGVGEIFNIHCEAGQYLPSWRPDVSYEKSVSARAMLGGGVLLELSHEFDYLRWIFGDVSWVSAWYAKQSKLKIDVEDSACVCIGFKSSAVAHVTMDFVRHDTTRRCTAVGEFGTLNWDGVSGSLTRFDPGVGVWKEVFLEPIERDQTYRSQFDSFLNAIFGNESDGSISAQGTDGLAVMKIISAMKESQTRGSCIVRLKDRT